MRSVLFVLILAALSGCRIGPPGATDAYAANQILFPDGELIGKSAISPDSLDRAIALLDRATAAGHPIASSNKAFTVMVQEGLLDAEPHFRAIVENENTAQRQRDQAYGMLAQIAAARPRLEAGLDWNDIPPGRHLDWADVLGEIAVLREGIAAGSATARPFLETRLEGLRRQRAGGNADADSLLALVEMG